MAGNPLRAPQGNNENNVAFQGGDRRRREGGSLYGSGGGGSMNDVIRRVETLEKGFDLIVSKLDGIAKGINDGRLENEKRLSAIEGCLNVIDTKLDTKASKMDLTPLETKVGTLDGKVSGLPGTPALITLVLGTVGLSLGGAAALAWAFVRLVGKAP